MTPSTPIRNYSGAGFTAPTPQNTPLTHVPISSGLARPGVSDIPEDEDDGDTVAKEVAAVLQSSTARSAIQSIVQERLASLVGQSSGYIESLPVETKRSLAALQGVQVKRDELQKDFKFELWELEKKYLNRSKPLYDRRAGIVSGTATPRLEEIEAGELQAQKDDEDYTPLPKPEADPESAPIADFWLTALGNHPGVRSFLSVRDIEALKALTDVQLSYLPGSARASSADVSEKESERDQLGYKLSFFFSKNDYFENEVLEKTYLYKPEIDWAGDYVYARAIGTEIRWKSDKDLTKDIQTKTQRSKSTNRTRTVQRAIDVESFFKFFSPPEPPSDDAIENGEIDDDDLSQLEAALMIDFQLGDDFKDRIIPHAVDYFTGKALEWEDDDEDGWEEDETDYEDDDDE